MASSCLLVLACWAAPAASSEIVRRVSVKANGRVRVNLQSRASSAWSSMAVHPAHGSGHRVWQALREDLETRKRDLDSESDNLVDTTSSRRDALWRILQEVDDNTLSRQACTVNANVAYSKLVDVIYTASHVRSDKECSLMCAIDPIALGNAKTSRHCESFAYNSTARECKFSSSPTQLVQYSKVDPCCASGLPCTLDDFRADIQANFDAEMKKHVMKEQKLQGQLAEVEHRYADSKKRNQVLQAKLVATKPLAPEAVKQQLHQTKLAVERKMRKVTRRLASNETKHANVEPTKVIAASKSAQLSTNSNVKGDQIHVQVVKPTKAIAGSKSPQLSANSNVKGDQAHSGETLHSAKVVPLNAPLSGSTNKKPKTRTRQEDFVEGAQGSNDEGSSKTPDGSFGGLEGDAAVRSIIKVVAAVCIILVLFFCILGVPMVTRGFSKQASQAQAQRVERPFGAFQEREM